jgi:dihydropteroate synthase
MVVAPPGSNVETDQRPGLNRLARLLARATPAVMGVLNVTPDSFSDGGRFIEPPNALEQARRMISEGADILDVGAESTRPYGGAKAVAIDEEMRRLAPILPAAVALGIPVSIDTMKASVAEWALAAGAAVINDVWGLQRDGDMAAVAAKHGAPVIIMHNRQHADPSIDIMADISGFFARSLRIAESAGIARDQIVLDPGIGFGKTPQQSLIAIARLRELKSFGLPLLVGASRKRFIASVSPAPPDQRLGGSIAAHVLAVANGAAIIRTHDVAETVQAVRVAAAIASMR